MAKLLSVCREFTVNSRMPLDMMPIAALQNMPNLERLIVTAACPLPEFDSLPWKNSLTYLEWYAKPEKKTLDSLSPYSILQRLRLRRFDDPECLEQLVDLGRRTPQLEFTFYWWHGLRLGAIEVHFFWDNTIPALNQFATHLQSTWFYQWFHHWQPSRVTLF